MYVCMYVCMHVCIFISVFLHACMYTIKAITHHCFGGTGRIDVCTAQGGGLAVARLAPKNPPMVVKGTWMNANITNTEACEQTNQCIKAKYTTVWLNKREKEEQRENKKHSTALTCHPSQQTYSTNRKSKLVVCFVELQLNEWLGMGKRHFTIVVKGIARVAW